MTEVYVKGVVEKIIFHNPDSMFYIASVEKKIPTLITKMIPLLLLGIYLNYKKIALISSKGKLL